MVLIVHHFTCEKDMDRILEQQTWKVAAVHMAAWSHQGQASLEYKQSHSKYEIHI